MYMRFIYIHIIYVCVCSNAFYVNVYELYACYVYVLWINKIISKMHFTIWIEHVWISTYYLHPAGSNVGTSCFSKTYSTKITTYKKTTWGQCYFTKKLARFSACIFYIVGGSQFREEALPSGGRWGLISNSSGLKTIFEMEGNGGKKGKWKN